MATKLVYNGSVATSFVAVGAELQPGQEFLVPDELAESFLQRPDIELATDHGMVESDDLVPPAPAKPEPAKKSVQPKPVAEAPEAE